jgi:hypothetical protein
MLLGVPSSARVAITGNSDDAQVEASDVTLDKLLSDLSAKFNFSYRSSTALDRKVINGTYAGSLLGILPRLLKDVDYALKTENHHIFLVLTDQKKSTAQPTIAVPITSTGPLASINSAAVAGGHADKTKIKSATNSTSGKILSATNPQSPALNPPPFVVPKFLEMQLAPVANRDLRAANFVPLAQGVSTETSHATLGQSLQRANVTLQALAGSLARLPQ